MEREPGKLYEVELGLWILGEVGYLVGLDNYHRAFAFRERVEGWLEYFTPFWRRLNPDHGTPFLCQGLNAFRQIFPHLGSILERADNGQLAVIVLQSGVLQILEVRGDGLEQRPKLVLRIKHAKRALASKWF